MRPNVVDLTAQITVLPSFVSSSLDSLGGRPRCDIPSAAAIRWMTADRDTASLSLGWGSEARHDFKMLHGLSLRSDGAQAYRIAAPHRCPPINYLLDTPLRESLQ